MFAMLLFSLAGIPPLAGFFAKWYVFVAATDRSGPAASGSVASAACASSESGWFVTASV